MHTRGHRGERDHHLRGGHDGRGDMHHVTDPQKLPASIVIVNKYIHMIIQDIRFDQRSGLDMIRDEALNRYEENVITFINHYHYSHTCLGKCSLLVTDSYKDRGVIQKALVYQKRRTMMTIYQGSNLIIIKLDIQLLMMGLQLEIMDNQMIKKMRTSLNMMQLINKIRTSQVVEVMMMSKCSNQLLKQRLWIPNFSPKTQKAKLYWSSIKYLARKREYLSISRENNMNT